MHRSKARRLGTKKYVVLIHVFAWLCFLSFPLLFINGDHIELFAMLRTGSFWFFALCFALAFYLNAYFWVPYNIARRRYVLYGISIVLIAGIFGFYLKPFDRLMRFADPSSPLNGRMPDWHSLEENQISGGDRQLPPPPALRPRPDTVDGLSVQRIDVASLYIFLLIIALGSLLQVVEYWLLAQNKAQQAEKDHMRAELSLLKAQVHPHFLFNTLNNLYSLALTSDQALAESIYKLSQLMRYYMDERESETLDIRVEIQAIQDFIGLQRLRAGEQCRITEHYEGLDHAKKIHPFILLPFVENAFKYGLSVTESSHLAFLVSLTADGCKLYVANSIPSNRSEQYRAGTGLKNTRRLLDHFYPDRFDLQIKETAHRFEVTLFLYI